MIDRVEKTNKKIRGSVDDPSGKTAARTLSQMEITYGTFNSLGALVMTGMERKLFSYQVTFRRNRDEGFSRDGSSIANSSTGSDDLVLDIGWSRDRFESGVSLRFAEKTTALQANTNFSQSRNTGVLLNWKGSYIFSSSGNFQFHLGVSGDRFVLDNPVNQNTVSSLGFRAGTYLNFSWASRSFFKMALTMMYQNMDSDDSVDADLKDPVFSVSGGFGFGPFLLSAGAALHIPGFEDPLAAPFAKLSVNSGGKLSFYFLVKRDITWMDHDRMLMKMPYATYSPVEKPEDCWRLGGGGKLKLGAFVLSFSLFYLDYSRYYAPEVDANSLYILKEENPGMLELTAESRVFLYKTLSIRLGFVKRFLDETISYLPEMLLHTSLEWRIPEVKTLITIKGRLEGARNDDALDPYFLLDAGVRQPIIKGLSVVFIVRNLLNADYRQRVGYFEPGISLHGGVNLRF